MLSLGKMVASVPIGVRARMRRPRTADSYDVGMRRAAASFAGGLEKRLSGKEVAAALQLDSKVANAAAFMVVVVVWYA